MNSFCTIADTNFLPYAYALYDSIKKNSSTEFSFYVFVSDREKKNDLTDKKEGINYVYIDCLNKTGLGKLIYDKYFQKYPNPFRWSMKPILMHYLITSKNHNKVIMLDSDIYFYKDPNFLFDLLDTNSVLLSPHFRSSDPEKNYINYVLQFSQGIFNGGMVGASYSGIEAINWWANSCLFLGDSAGKPGHYYDQIHLNLIPVYFDNVHILKHKGCNVAKWNLLECKRSLQDDGTVLIQNKYPIVFIHFANSTIKGIVNGEDSSLFNYLKIYSENYKKYNPNRDLITWAKTEIEKKSAQDKRDVKLFFKRGYNYLLRTLKFKK